MHRWIDPYAVAGLILVGAGIAIAVLVTIGAVVLVRWALGI